MNSWELLFESKADGPRVVRGHTRYFEEYLPLVRLARKYPIRYILCTTALTELEKLPRSLSPYIIPESMPFSTPDIFGVLACRQNNLEDAVAQYAKSRYLDRWLLIDSTYERRDISTHGYMSIACEPTEGLANQALITKITRWLESQ